MTKVLEKLLPEILKRLSDVQAVYSFGSHARGDALPDSDIDIAVLASSTLSETDVWNTAQKLASLAKKEVDLVDLNKASTVMRMQVISKGTQVYCQNSNRCAQFEDFVYSDYARLNEERAGILHDIAQRGTIYG